MNPTRELDCPAAREALSGRLDGELADESALRVHLESCGACRAHERSLAALVPEWAALRDATPPAQLWTRIEARARPRLDRSALRSARLAAGVIGFLGLWSTFWMLANGADEVVGGPHLLERLLSTPTLSPTLPNELFDSLPEYQLLRGLSTPTRNPR